jgi:4'-phosphopantetheinyl transferase
MTADGLPLNGWEFRIFIARVGVVRGSTQKDEAYLCVCAFFRGSPHTTFLFQNDQKVVEKWVQFLTLDQILKVAPKMRA